MSNSASALGERVPKLGFVGSLRIYVWHGSVALAVATLARVIIGKDSSMDGMSSIGQLNLFKPYGVPVASVYHLSPIHWKRRQCPTAASAFCGAPCCCFGVQFNCWAS